MKPTPKVQTARQHNAENFEMGEVESQVLQPDAVKLVAYQRQLINHVRKYWRCTHKDIGGNNLMQDGWCPKCGNAHEEYTFKVGFRDTIVSAANGTIFEHSGRLIWYTAALSEIMKGKHQWQQ